MNEVDEINEDRRKRSIGDMMLRDVIMQHTLSSGRTQQEQYLNHTILV